MIILLCDTFQFSLTSFAIVSKVSISTQDCTLQLMCEKIKTAIFLCLIDHWIIKVCGGMEILPKAFLNFALDCLWAA